MRGGRPFDTTGPRPRFYIDALWGFQLKELPGGRTRLVVSGYASNFEAHQVASPYLA